MNAFGQAAFVQAEGESVGGRRGKIGQTVVQLKDEGRGRECPQGDGGVASFQPPKCVATDEKARGHIRGGDTAPAAGKREIAAQLAERVGGWEGNGRRLRHDK